MANKIVIITGPGGVGKTTISQFLCQNLSEEFRETVSCTTRNKREHELNGKDYYFISQEDFENKIANNEFIEYNKFPNGYMYGTLYSEVLGILKNSNCIIVMDPVTASTLKENPFFKEHKTESFFLNADEGIVRRRLVKRGASKQEINQRLQIAKDERQYAKFCDHRVFVKNPYYASNRVYKILTGKNLEI